MKNKITLIVLAIIVLGVAIALVAKGGKGPTINPNASPVAQCNQFCTSLSQACKDQCSEIKCSCFSKSTSTSPTPGSPAEKALLSEYEVIRESTNRAAMPLGPSCGSYTNQNSCNADSNCIWACYPANPITLPGGYTCSLSSKPSPEPKPVPGPAPLPEPTPVPTPTPPAPAPEKGCCLSEKNEYMEKCRSFPNETDCKLKGAEAGFYCYWSSSCIGTEVKERELPILGY